MVDVTTTESDLHAADLRSLFDLEAVSSADEVSWFYGRLRQPVASWPKLYGGQVAAQSLIAAGRTVPSGRKPHSLHGYFLRVGEIDRKIEFRVDHDRDGRSFSARHVSAMQGGRVIFSMLTSFCAGEATAVLDNVPRHPLVAPEPRECASYPIDPHLEVRQITTFREHEGRQLHPDSLWVRVPDELPDDALTNAAALAYMSDLGSGFGQTLDPSVGIGGPSLDHAMWFQQPLDPRDWLRLDMWPASAVHERGVYHRSLRDRSGRLGATLVQENLLR